MTPRSTSSPSSVLEGGKLKPGIYKIQNIQSETYLDIEIHTGKMCCRPAKDLGEGRGVWEIKNFGVGYTVQFVEPGKPEQFCTRTGKLGESQLVVAAYPVAWRVEVVDDAQHRGFEYIRFCWGITDLVWNLDNGSRDNGAKVEALVDGDRAPRRIWKLTSAKVEGAFASPPLDSGPLPSYDEDATGESTSTRAQHTGSERDEFGTIVTEVTIVTTRKRYRVEDA